MKNWKTTLLGVLAAIGMSVSMTAQNKATNPAAPPLTTGNLVSVVAVAALGALAKDANTGN